jgi:siderophore ferric iron reductase
MGQSIRQGFVGGFNLPPDCPLRSGDRNLVENAAERLMNLLERQLEEFNGVFNIYPKLARLLIADCARAALLLLQRHQGMSNGQLRELEDRWLQALGFPGKSPLIEVSLEDGSQCLALGRNACCQHFRRADGEPCAGCPRLKPAERLQRFREELVC